jgi:hypothetical protein
LLLLLRDPTLHSQIVWPFVKQRQLIDLSRLVYGGVVRGDVVYMPHWEQRSDEMEVPDCPPVTGSAWAVQRLHDAMMTSLRDASLPTSRNLVVYLHRSPVDSRTNNTRSRGVVNSEELLDVLRRRLKPHLELVTFTEPSGLEPAQAAARAVVLIAPEGGALLVRSRTTYQSALSLSHTHGTLPLSLALSLSRPSSIPTRVFPSRYNQQLKCHALVAWLRLLTIVAAGVDVAERGVHATRPVVARRDAVQHADGTRSAAVSALLSVSLSSAGQLQQPDVLERGRTRVSEPPRGHDGERDTL